MSSINSTIIKYRTLQIKTKTVRKCSCTHRSDRRGRRRKKGCCAPAGGVRAASGVHPAAGALLLALLTPPPTNPFLRQSSAVLMSQVQYVPEEKHRSTATTKTSVRAGRVTFICMVFFGGVRWVVGGGSRSYDKCVITAALLAR